MITPNQLREKQLLHAEHMLEDFAKLKAGLSNYPDQRRALGEYAKLLELAVEVVTASDDAVFDKIAELESFLR